MYIDVFQIRSPVYSMTINPRRQQLVCGMSGRICAYDLDPGENQLLDLYSQTKYVFYPTLIFNH